MRVIGRCVSAAVVHEHLPLDVGRAAALVDEELLADVEIHAARADAGSDAARLASGESSFKRVVHIDPVAERKSDAPEQRGSDRC